MRCVASWNHRTRSTPSHSWSLFYRHAGHTSEWWTSAMRCHFRQIAMKNTNVRDFIYTSSYQRTAIPIPIPYFFVVVVYFPFLYMFQHRHEMWNKCVQMCSFGIRFDSIKMVMHMATTIFININERGRSSTTSKSEHGWTRNVLFIYSLAFFLVSFDLCTHIWI